MVAFSRHAIEQTCERIVPRWTTYAGAGDVFAFFDRCVYFERRELHQDQLAFTFYDFCAPSVYWTYLYVQEVLGVENVDPNKGDCYYRVGYCPAVVEGDFVKAKTLLFPGFASTPEYGAIVRSNLPSSEKQELMKRARACNASCLQEDCDFSTIKWYHDNGVPQVVQLQREVFAPIWEPSKEGQRSKG